MAYAYSLKSINNEVLKIVDNQEHRTLHTIAANQEGALYDFGKELDKTFNLTPPEQPSLVTHLLAEHDYTKGCYWINFKIPVFEI